MYSKWFLRAFPFSLRLLESRRVEGSMIQPIRQTLKEAKVEYVGWSASISERVVTWVLSLESLKSGFLRLGTVRYRFLVSSFVEHFPMIAPECRRTLCFSYQLMHASKLDDLFTETNDIPQASFLDTSCT
jgi:hypothetical protein